jgi:hypothetical protein
MEPEESTAITTTTRETDWDEIERTITRKPRKLYEWVCDCNEKNGDFFSLAQDTDNRVQVKALCILVSRRQMTVKDFLSHVLNLDLFSSHDKYYFPIKKHRVPPTKLDFNNFPTLPKAEIDQITSTPGWARVFARPDKFIDRQD